MMKKTKNNWTGRSQSRFVSAWDREEEPIAIIDYNPLEIYSTNDDIGVMLNFSNEIEFVKEEAAFLFGSSPDKLLFRANFGCLVEIPTDDEEKQKSFERLYKSRFGTFIDCRDGLFQTKEHGIPVCLDALSLIPLTTDDID